MDFAIPAEYRVKLKESEKRDKYLDLARDLKNLLNMKVIVISIVTGMLGTITKGLVQGHEDWKIRGWDETIQIRELLRSARIIRRVLETAKVIIIIGLHSYMIKYSYTNNLHTVLWYQVFLSNINNLYTIIWFQVFLSNTNDLYTITWFQVDNNNNP